MYLVILATYASILEWIGLVTLIHVRGDCNVLAMTDGCACWSRFGIAFGFTGRGDRFTRQHLTIIRGNEPDQLPDNGPPRCAFVAAQLGQNSLHLVATVSGPELPPAPPFVGRPRETGNSHRCSLTKAGESMPELLQHRLPTAQAKPP